MNNQSKFSISANLQLVYVSDIERSTAFYKNIFSDYRMTPIKKNKLGDSAGVIGAALIGASMSC